MSFQRSKLLLATACLLAAAGCSRKSSLEPYPPITDPLVFGDTFGSNVNYQAFLGSKLDGLSIDSTVKYIGAASLKAVVPAPNDPTGGYTGGAFVTRKARDLSGYNALSFWVKASRPVNLDVAGLGNDNTGNSLYTAQRSTIPITATWTQVYVPIPSPARLTDEKGLFFFAEGPQSGAGLTVWFDEVKFVNTAEVTNPRPSLVGQTIDALVGAQVSLAGITRTTFNISGVDRVVTHLPGYFDFTSTNSSVAYVSGNVIRVMGSGSASISATMNGAAVPGTIVVNASAPPASAAPTPPARQPADVISLFSGAYSNVVVDSWSPPWDIANVEDVNVAGNPTKLYTGLGYAGILFETHPIDATAMDYFHMDIWSPSGTVFKAKLVDYGADGVFGGDDDSEYEVTIDGASTPPFATGTWVSLDIPLSAFSGLIERGHLAQLFLSGDIRTLFVDNVYFHK